MKSAFDLVSWSERVLEKKRKEDAFADKMATYCAVSCWLTAELGEAQVAGDAERAAEIRGHRDRFERDEIQALLDSVKELSR